MGNQLLNGLENAVKQFPLRFWHKTLKKGCKTNTVLRLASLFEKDNISTSFRQKIDNKGTVN